MKKLENIPYFDNVDLDIIYSILDTEQDCEFQSKCLQQFLSYKSISLSYRSITDVQKN